MCVRDLRKPTPSLWDAAWPGAVGGRGRPPAWALAGCKTGRFSLPELLFFSSLKQANDSLYQISRSPPPFLESQASLPRRTELVETTSLR